MQAIRFNHVSVHARNLEDFVRFYVDIFGIERLKRRADSVPPTGDALEAMLYLEKAEL